MLLPDGIFFGIISLMIDDVVREGQSSTSMERYPLQLLHYKKGKICEEKENQHNI